MGAAQQMLMGEGFKFNSFSTAYTTPGAQTVAIPAGATKVTVEAIGAGGGASFSGTFLGGGGGAYAKKTAYSVSGLTAVYIVVPTSASAGISGASAVARENNSSGTVICSAQGGNWNRTGGTTAGSVGDVLRAGGAGATDGGATYTSGGGGAAGPVSAGGDGTNTGVGGTSGGSPAGAGGNADADGAYYGGGGGIGNAHTGMGRQGWLKLTWE